MPRISPWLVFYNIIGFIGGRLIIIRYLLDSIGTLIMLILAVYSVFSNSLLFIVFMLIIHV